jgi:uncharacterized protein
MPVEKIVRQTGDRFRVPGAKRSVPQLSAFVAFSLLFVLVLAPLRTSSAAEITVRDTGEFVIDPAGKIDSKTTERLEKLLKDLENKTTAQVKLLVVETTSGEDIFDFSQRHALLWQLGQKGKDNGALIVLAINDRNVRIHTGKGLEGSLPDSWTGTTSRRIAQQYFKSGQYSAGIEELTKLTALRVAEDAGVTLDGNPQPVDNRPVDAGWSPGLPFIIFLIVLIFIFARGSGGRRRRYQRTWGGPFFGGIGGLPSTGGWTSTSGSDWSGGGFGGGFGGGGGGSFGGGGDFGGGGGGASW